MLQVLRYTSENVFVPLTVGEELEISQIQLEGKDWEDQLGADIKSLWESG
ncbi:hypothetical protein JHK86_023241 [Glycine max]|nr:hypothetical protein JHK86_023241 [Glycine max]